MAVTLGKGAIKSENMQTSYIIAPIGNTNSSLSSLMNRPLTKPAKTISNQLSFKMHKTGTRNIGKKNEEWGGQSEGRKN